MTGQTGRNGRAMKMMTAMTGLCLAAAAITLATASGVAQNVVPVPIVTNLVGIAPGGSVAACGTTTDIPTFAANPGPFHVGDGCPGTQATLFTPYSATVDSLGNIYISDYGHFSLRVLYNGGAALSAAIVAANPNVAGLVPQPGKVYELAGGSRQGNITQTGNPLKYYCSGQGAGPIASNNTGLGCPGTEAEVKPRQVAIDADGNIFFPNIAGGTQIKVLYVGGAAAAKLIQLENPTLTGSPQPGYLYSVAGAGTTGYSGDGGLASLATFIVLRSVAVDANENLYISDGTTGGAAAGYTIRKVNGTTGIITTIAGGAGCVQPVAATVGCPVGVTGGSDGDNGPATSATLTGPYSVWLDANNNVYFADSMNARIRVVYQGSGSLVGITNPQNGYIYTVAGGGATNASVPTASGTPATQLAFGQILSGGIDFAGNLYLFDGINKYVWKVDGKTGIATILGGVGPTALAAAAGAYCSGAAGPKSTSTAGDGCPATQAAMAYTGAISFDAQGNIYETESTNAVVRKLSFNTQFPSTAVGASSTQPLAYATVSSSTVTAETFSIQGQSGSEFADAGGGTCALNSLIAADTTCVFNVKFSPAAAGSRNGNLGLAGPNTSNALTGLGLAATVSVGPGSQATIGSGSKPSGVGTDSLGNLYVSDTTSGTVKKVSAAGGTPATLITGLSKPAQIAVDGKGTVYVADAGNNRIATAPAAGGAATSIGSGFSAPTGVVVDGLGNVYVADTGNNRVVKLGAAGGQATLPISGLSAPQGLAIDTAGNLFVADSGNKRVVELGATTGQLTLNLGTTTFTPTAVAVDAAGDLYVTDSTNLQVTSFATGSTNGNPIVTGLVTPAGLAIDVNGSLYIADSGATGVVALNRAVGNITYPVTNVGQVNPASLTLSNSGNQPLSFAGTSLASNVTVPYSLASASSNGCQLGTANAIAPGGSCLITASFAPTTPATYIDTITPNTNAANNGSVSAVLSGLAVHLTSTTTTLSVTSPATSPYYYGQTLVITATTTLGSNVGVPLGNFVFTVDGRQQPAVSFGSTSTSTTVLTATLTLTGLTVGAHSVSVNEIFTAPPYLYASSPSSLNFSVLKALTTTTLTAVPSSSGATVSTTFTATVTPSTASGATGTISFYSGTTLLNAAPIAISPTTGIATYSSPLTAFPSNSFSAVYSGDANFATSTSTTLSPAGNFNLTTPTAVVNIPQGGNVTNSIVLTPYFGYTGTVTPTCSGLPKYANCSFQPVTVAVSGTSQVQFTISIYTNTTEIGRNEIGGGSNGIAWAALSPLGLLAFVLARRKRLPGNGAWIALALLVSLCGAVALSGCTNPVEVPNPSVVTPASTQSIVVTMADKNTPQLSRSIPFTLNVCNASVTSTCQTF